MAENDLLDDIRGAMAEVSGETAPETPPVATETVAPEETAPEAKPPADGRERDEQGRFKPASELKPKPKEAKPRETLSLKSKDAPGTGIVPPEGAQPAKATVPEAAGTKPEVVPPPANWKGSAKLDWNRLPASTQQEFMARINEVEAARTELAPLKELIDLNKPLLVREAGSVQEGVRQLFAFHQLSIDRPLDLINHIARSRGIDLRAAFAGQPQQAAQQQAPDINRLIESRVQQALQPILAQSEQRENQQIEQTVTAFRADPKHPYFEDVRHQMGVLLKAGSAKSMDEAYDMACWANPTIRAALQQRANEEADKTKREAAEKARRASAANLRGSPLPNVTPGKSDRNASVLDDVRAAVAEVSGA